jgi:NADH-quinone oxidoreductase subunit C
MTDIHRLSTQLNARFADWIDSSKIALGELTLEVKAERLIELCRILHDDPEFDFKLLVDVCGVDYLHYGLAEWETDQATEGGFSRGVNNTYYVEGTRKSNRFAVVYHLLSLSNNFRIRLRVNIPNDKELIVDSVVEIWPAADWFEREAFDLFGVLFRGHPDLRRILTDYGFVGHPFRKDFPLIGKVEARYDAKLKRVIYDPVSIEPRVLEPKVIRHDNRYLVEPGDSHGK